MEGRGERADVDAGCCKIDEGGAGGRARHGDGFPSRVQGGEVGEGQGLEVRECEDVEVPQEARFVGVATVEAQMAY